MLRILFFSVVLGLFLNEISADQKSTRLKKESNLIYSLNQDLDEICILCDTITDEKIKNKMFLELEDLKMALANAYKLNDSSQIYEKIELLYENYSEILSGYPDRKFYIKITDRICNMVSHKYEFPHIYNTLLTNYTEAEDFHNDLK